MDSMDNPNPANKDNQERLWIFVYSWLDAAVQSGNGKKGPGNCG
jgi:hypothetical protein